MTNFERQEEIWAVIEQNADKPEVYWPLVVDFVYDWINQYDGPGHAMKPGVMAYEWHEAQA